MSDLSDMLAELESAGFLPKNGKQSPRGCPFTHCRFPGCDICRVGDSKSWAAPAHSDEVRHG